MEKAVSLVPCCVNCFGKFSSWDPTRDRNPTLPINSCARWELFSTDCSAARFSALALSLSCKVRGLWRFRKIDRDVRSKFHGKIFRLQMGVACNLHQLANLRWLLDKHPAMKRWSCNPTPRFQIYSSNASKQAMNQQNNGDHGPVRFWQEIPKTKKRPWTVAKSSNINILIWV